MEHRKKARIYIIASMVIFGTIGVFVRNINLPSGEIALYRAVLAVILIGIYLLSKPSVLASLDRAALKKELPLLILSGIAVGINWILLFEAYKYTTVSVATLSYYFAPVLVTVLAPILFKERLTRRQILCFIMSTIGLILIIGITDLIGAGGAGAAGSANLKGILFGLGAAVFYASVVLLNKSIRHTSGIPRTFLQFLAAVLILVPYVAWTGGSHLSSLDMTGVICLLVVGIVHTGITYCMYFSSLRDLTGQEASILSYMDPLVAIICSVTILHESMTLMQALGGVLILGFTIYNELEHK